MEYKDIYIVLGIILIHWFADFVCQSDWQAKNKSKQWGALLSHTVIYSLIWAVFGYLNLMILIITTECKYDFVHQELIDVFYFAVITFIIHTIQDYFTSRLNSKLWTEGKVHLFFVSIGFDQVLHYAQLLLTYKLLS